MKRAKYETKDGVKIIGVVEEVLVTTYLTGDFLKVDEHGEPTGEYEVVDDPFTRPIYWDTCRPSGEPGNRVFQGEDGADYFEQDLVVVKSEDD